MSFKNFKVLKRKPTKFIGIMSHIKLSKKNVLGPKKKKQKKKNKTKIAICMDL
jgi:hypothetical protein